MQLYYRIRSFVGVTAEAICLTDTLYNLQHSHYFIRIERFMPKVEIVNKHNAAARRLYIRGHNGKVIIRFYLCWLHCFVLRVVSKQGRANTKTQDYMLFVLEWTEVCHKVA